MHGLSEAIALCGRTFHDLRHDLLVRHLGRAPVAASLREAAAALASFRAGEAWDPAVPAWRLKTERTLAETSLLVTLVSACAVVAAELADAAETGSTAELVRAADHLEALVGSAGGALEQALADAALSTDPWEARLAALVGQRVELPAPGALASPQGRVRVLLQRLQQQWVSDPACRDVWDAVDRGVPFPDGAVDVLLEAAQHTHPINGALLVRAAVVVALEQGREVVWPEALGDLVARALRFADVRGLDVQPLLAALAPWEGSDRSDALLRWVQRLPSRFEALAEICDLESAPRAAKRCRQVGPMPPAVQELLARSVLEGSVEARREAMGALVGVDPIPTVRKAARSALADPDAAVVRLAAQALAGWSEPVHLGPTEPEVRLGALAAFDAAFDGAAASALAWMLLDDDARVRWGARRALDRPGRDRFLPDEAARRALEQSDSEDARWWRFRLWSVHPEVDYRLPVEMPSWATCRFCCHVPRAESGRSLSAEAYAHLRPAPDFGAEGDGAGACPSCGRVYAWKVEVDPRDLFPVPRISIGRVTPTRAAALGLPMAGRSEEALRRCLEHPERWVREDAASALSRT